MKPRPAPISKPRTPKQRAAAQAYSGSKSGLFISPAPEPPKDSWWIKAKDRSEFMALAHAEEPRIRQQAGRRITTKAADAEEGV